MGTLYRRFGDRDALALAVVRASLETVLAATRAAADEEPRAWDGLVRAMARSPALALTLRADVTTADVEHLFGLLLRGHHALDRPGDRTAFERARLITLDGLRVGPRTELPGSPAG